MYYILHFMHPAREYAVEKECTTTSIPCTLKESMQFKKNVLQSPFHSPWKRVCSLNIMYYNLHSMHPEKESMQFRKNVLSCPVGENTACCLTIHPFWLFFLIFFTHNILQPSHLLASLACPYKCNTHHPINILYSSFHAPWKRVCSLKRMY